MWGGKGAIGGKDPWGKGSGKGKKGGKSKGFEGGSVGADLYGVFSAPIGGAGKFGGKYGGKDAGKGKKGFKGGWGGAGKGAGFGGGDWVPEQSAWVTAWHEERGFGFVTLASGDDVYVHRTVLMDGEALTVGSEVWVGAQWDHFKGKWAASSCSGAAAAGKGAAGFGKGSKGGKGKGKGKGKISGEFMNGVQAWVKTWNEERGFGFVSTGSGEDVYCHRTSLQDGSFLTPEAEIVVDAKWLWDKAKWQAIKVTGASGDAPTQAGVEEPAQLGEQTGTVKAWNPRGFGFIMPDLGGADIYVHRTALTDGKTELPVGHVVTFDVQFDEATNKYLAITCTDSGEMSDKPLPETKANVHANGSFGKAKEGKSALAGSEPY